MQLKRRHDLIPNLVETVKGYAPHERQVFENVTAARSNAVAAQRPRGAGAGRERAHRRAAPAVRGRRELPRPEGEPELPRAAERAHRHRGQDPGRAPLLQHDRARPEHQGRVVPVARHRRHARTSQKREFFELDEPADREVPAVSFGTAPARAGSLAASRHAAQGRAMYKQITSNKRKSLALLFGFLLLYARARLAAVAVVRRLARSAIAIVDRDRDGDRQPLHGRRPGRCAVSGARQVERKEEAPELWRMVENLAITAGLPMPRVYIVARRRAERVRGRPQPEAGDRRRHDRAARAARRGGARGRARARDEPHPQLRRAADDLGGGAGRLDRAARADLHARRCGSAAATATAAAANPIVLVARGRWRSILAPIAAVVIQTAISRRREYVADASRRRADALPAGPGLGAAHDLERSTKPSARARQPGDRAPDDRAAAAAAAGARCALFSTHPPTEDRIARLEEMAGGQQHRHETLTEGAGMPVAGGGDRRRRRDGSASRVVLARAVPGPPAAARCFPAGRRSR